MRRSGPRAEHRPVAWRRALLLLLIACAVAGCGAARTTITTTARGEVAKTVHRRPPEWRLAASVTGRLATPLQDAAPAVAHGVVVLLGGLSAADTSTSGVIHATATGSHKVGTLPAAIHDAAAATSVPRRTSSAVATASRNSTRSCGRRRQPRGPPAAAELGPGGSHNRRHRLRRRRVHRHALARHDRRVRSTATARASSHTCRRRSATPPSPPRAAG